MAELYEQHNSDDVLVRSVIAGLLNLLNNNIKYSQTWSSDTKEELFVPWYYDFSHANNERFLQDNFTFFGERCFNQRMIDGNFDKYPKGILTYKSSTINAQSVTNVFTTGKYTKNVDGVLTTYSSFVYSLPIDMVFSCEVYTADTDFLSILKIEQAIREAFYKNRSFYVTYKGMRVGCTAGFPESSEFASSMQLTHDNIARENKLTFTIGIETYQPCIDEKNEIPADCSMSAIGVNTDIGEDNKMKLTVTHPVTGDNTIYEAGSDMIISWDLEHGDDVNSFCIKYIDESTGESYNIAKAVSGNRESYVWKVPYGLSDFVQPIIMSDSDRFIEKPIVTIVPTNGYITADSFHIYNRGTVNTIDPVYIDFSIEYEDKDGNIIIDNNYQYLCMNGQVESVLLKNRNNPTTYKGNFDTKNISIVVETLSGDIVSSKVKHIKVL